MIKPSSAPMTIDEMEAWIQRAKDGGAKGNTPLYISSGAPGNEQFLLALTAITNWQVVCDPAGGANCARLEQTDREAIPAAVCTVGEATLRGAWGFRFKDRPRDLFIVPGANAAAYWDMYGRALLVPAIPFQSYAALTLYIARDVQDKTTPEIKALYVPEVPIRPGGKVFTYDLSDSVCMRNSLMFRQEYGAVMFPDSYNPPGVGVMEKRPA